MSTLRLAFGSRIRPFCVEAIKVKSPRRRAIDFGLKVAIFVPVEGDDAFTRVDYFHISGICF